MNAPKAGDKIRLTNLDEISRKCGYMPGDEGTIIVVEPIEVGSTSGETYQVKFTKLQDQACADFHLGDHASDAYHDYFFAGEFEVIQ